MEPASLHLAPSGFISFPGGGMMGKFTLMKKAENG